MSSGPRKQMPVIPSDIAEGFPLSWHAGVGLFCKKKAGVQYYFGPKPREALERFAIEWPYISVGKPVPVESGFTVRDLCEKYAEHQRSRRARNEIGAVFLQECIQTAEFLATKLGGYDVASLKPSDFDEVRTCITGTPAIVANKIGRVKAVFKFGYDMELLDKPVRFGIALKPPTRGERRRHKARIGAPLFTREEILQLLGKAGPLLKAAILLGINAGLYAKDVSDLSHRHIQGEWVEFARLKSGIDRKFWLWPETREAIETAKDTRTDRVFSRKNGDPLVTGSEEGVRVDTIGGMFWKLKKSLGITGPNKGFKSFRHTYRTIADQLGDQPAVTITMGHVDAGISAEYRHLGREAEKRLQAVALHVRQWLFGESVSCIDRVSP